VRILDIVVSRALLECVNGVLVSMVVMAVLYVVGFALWTTWISFTDSTLLPDYAFVGFKHYGRLLQTRIWQVAYANLVVYGIGFMVFATAIGLVVAIPATIFYNKFASEVNKHAHRLEGFADEFAAVIRVDGPELFNGREIDGGGV